MNGLSVETMEPKGFLPRAQQEAAFFYGLFIRGYPLQKLREDIDVSPRVVEKWSQLAARDPNYGQLANQLFTYRKRVLAIFDTLIFNEMQPTSKTQ